MKKAIAGDCIHLREKVPETDKGAVTFQ